MRRGSAIAMAAMTRTARAAIIDPQETRACRSRAISGAPENERREERQQLPPARSGRSPAESVRCRAGQHGDGQRRYEQHTFGQVRVNRLEPGQQRVHTRMQRRPLGKREDHSRRGNEEPEGQGRPAQGDERREERESDDGRAHILPTGPAKPADQVGDDLLERNADVRFGPAGKSGVDPTGEIRPGVRLEAHQKRGRVETKPDQKAAATDADQTDQTLRERTSRKEESPACARRPSHR